MVAVTPAETRAARAFLRKRGISTQEVPPRKFSAASKELSTGFRETLRFIITTQEKRNGTSRKSGRQK